MSYVNWQLERQPYSGNSTTGWTGSVTTITTFQDPSVTVNLGEAKDSFGMKFSNVAAGFSNYFQPNDKITISRVLNASSFASSDVLMVGTVGNAPETVSYNDKSVRVEGFNFSETILSGIVFADTSNLTVDTALQLVLNAIGVYNGSFTVTWNSNNPSKKRDTTTSFPLVTERWFNKSVKAFIEKYSTNAATQDGDYYWYVDKDNTLVWRPRATTVSYTFNSSTDNYRTLKIGKDIKDVRNWVIIKGGTDPDGKPIQTRVEDPASIAKHGLKPYILANVAKNAEMLVKQDINYFNVATMAVASYPLTPTWTTTSATNYNTVGSATSYIKLLRDYVIAQAKIEGNAFLARSKYGKLLVDVEFTPGKGWGLGSLIDCTIPALGSGSTSLRVKEVRYTTNADIFQLEEDTGTL